MCRRLYIHIYRVFMDLNLSKDSLFIWFLRYWHMVGVKILFVSLFIHMARVLYYSSNIKKGVNVGFTLYLLVMGEAFTGFILPWHQIYYWATMVLTSLVDSLPIFRRIVYKYVLGDFSVSGVALVRVLSVHICLGFIALGLMVVHMFYLHKKGGSKPLFSFKYLRETVCFHFCYTFKDLVLFMIVANFLVF
eukprot:TsM_000113600 transcript=TsM_000113600 gene=TsM_000113600